VNVDDKDALRGESAGRLEFPRRKPEDPALIMFSSGTTGHPKAIVHGQGGMGHAVTLGLLLDEAYEALYAREFGVDPFAGIGTEVPATVLSSPLFHVAGLLPYLRAIAKGSATIMIGKWNADTVYDILEQNTVIRLVLVPTMIFDMLASPRMASGALSQLRFLANGTAALAPRIASAIREALPQCLLTNTYGQTETMERVAGFGGREYEANLDAVGRVVPTTMLRVLREDGSDAEPGEVGEIAAYGANTMTGYHGDPEAGTQSIRDGWILSGDLGHFDEQGLLRIVDRKKNMVIAGGENIYCAEVERVMAEHPAVAEALAFGEPDPRLGERLVAVAVLKPGETLDEDELKAHCRANLAIYKVPRAIGFTHAPLPRNATGKVAKGEFLQAYERPWAEQGETQT
jgi:long-chain acyl-CoA synthetase